MLGDGNQKTLHPLASSLFSKKKKKKSEMNLF